MVVVDFPTPPLPNQIARRMGPAERVRRDIARRHYHRCSRRAKVVQPFIHGRKFSAFYSFISSIWLLEVTTSIHLRTLVQQNSGRHLVCENGRRMEGQGKKERSQPTWRAGWLWYAKKRKIWVSGNPQLMGTNGYRHTHQNQEENGIATPTNRGIATDRRAGGRSRTGHH